MNAGRPAVNELAHVRLGHLDDLIAFELLAALCWTNSLWRWAPRELRLVHELQADRAAARTARLRPHPASPRPWGPTRGTCSIPSTVPSS
ncbi:MAG: hypothetical protein IPM68_05725 [Flavobacteriales bacterium]|nr:hypothetical protein [Flavobacteriales bacterium]